MNEKGFSLVELIIVIAIMAILIGLLAPQFVKYVEQSRESRDLKTIEEIKIAIEAYSSEHEQRGSHTVVSDGTKIEYTLDDGGSLEEFGIEEQTVLSSSDKIIVTWSFEDSKWSVVDNCVGFYDAYGARR